MDTPTVQVHNFATGEQYFRDMTTEEIAERKVMQDELALQAIEQADKATAKQAVLNKLGLTADEVTALFG